jgi:hypothetical protein
MSESWASLTSPSTGGGRGGEDSGRRRTLRQAQTPIDGPRPDLQSAAMARVGFGRDRATLTAGDRLQRAHLGCSLAAEARHEVPRGPDRVRHLRRAGRR